MPTQSNFSGGRGALDWAGFLDGLRHGHAWAYFLLIGLAVAATVASWAGSGVMRKGTNR